MSRDLQCSYTTSRRGRRRDRQATNELVEARDTSPPPFQLSPPPQCVSDPSLETRQTRASVKSVDRVTNSSQSETSLLPQVPNGPSTQRTEITPQWIDDEWLVNLYYLDFHPNHPILIPKNMYWKRNYPWYLKAVVEFIGSHFSQATTLRALQEDVRKELEREGCRTAATVQARLLYATILLAQNESRSCQQMLSYAVDAATGLGLHRRGFAISHTNGQWKKKRVCGGLGTSYTCWTAVFPHLNAMQSSEHEHTLFTRMFCYPAKIRLTRTEWSCLHYIQGMTSKPVHSWMKRPSSRLSAIALRPRVFSDEF